MWRRLFGHRPSNSDIDAEVEAHLRLAAFDRMDAGEPQKDAERHASWDLGGRAQVVERIRDVRSGAWADRLGREARDAFRALVRTPTVTLTAGALIALVVGGNLTIFSTAYAILTRPARGVQSGRLVTLETHIRGGHSGPEQTYIDYLYFAQTSRTVRPLMASQFERFALGMPTASYAYAGELVSANYFEALGVQIERGRAFVALDEQRGADLQAVISDRLWRERFGRDESLLGRSILLNTHPVTIVGVVAPPFQGAWLTSSSDIWMPLVPYARVAGSESTLVDHADLRLMSIGQLADGSSLARAQSEFTALNARLQASFPDTNGTRMIELVPYSVTAGGDSLVAQQGWRFLGVFSIITLLTVLIVCANVANLMLARALARQREVAVRQALGASKGTIVRTALFEGLIISAGAWAAACVVATWITKIIGRLLPQSSQSAAFPLDFAPDWRIVGYAAVLALFGAAAFTLPLAIRGWRQPLIPWLKAGGEAVAPGRSRLSTALVVLQLTFAVLLLTSAGLAYRSLWLLGGRDIGFATDHLLLTTVNTSGAASDPDRNAILLDRALARVQTLPNVTAASYARSLPSSWWQQTPIAAPGMDRPVFAQTTAVGSEYLAALGLVPLAGRDMAVESGQPRAAIVNKNLADTLWPGESAVGRTVRVGARPQEVQIVGVSPNALFSGAHQDTKPNFLLLADDQRPAAPGQMTFYVKYRGTLDGIASTVDAALRDIDPRMAIASTRTMDSEFDAMTLPVRLLTRLLALFALCSLAVAALGEYAAVAFDMRRRTRDFGIRLALGATRGQILRSVLQQGLVWTVCGVALGWALSVAAARALRGLLYGITPTDTAAYLGVLALLVVTSLAACYPSAERAALVNPVRALRDE